MRLVVLLLSLAVPTVELPEIEWRLPVGCDFSGFFTEVVGGFLPFLVSEPEVRLVLLQQPTCSDDWIDSKLTRSEAGAYRSSQLVEAARPSSATRASIAIEHAEPCKMRVFKRPADRPIWVISRSMSEGYLPPKEARCLRDRADEVWVPTQFHVEMFAKASVPRDKLVVIPEAVPIAFFDPGAVQPTAVAELRGRSAAAYRSGIPGRPEADRQLFVFFSVFKWEQRKGWDVLLRAYWKEFKRRDPVVLRLRTYVPHWEPPPHDVNVRVRQYAAKVMAGAELTNLAAVEIVTEEVSREQMRNLYASSDAFVLPSRGEGWGLPVMEAMAMGKPVLVTNYSGPAEMMSSENSYPIGWAGGGTATAGKVQPSQQELQAAMRRCFTNPVEAASKGSKARQDIIAKYDPAAIAKQIANQLHVSAQKAASLARRGFPQSEAATTADSVKLPKKHMQSDRPGSGDSSRSNIVHSAPVKSPVPVIKGSATKNGPSEVFKDATVITGGGSLPKTKPTRIVATATPLPKSRTAQQEVHGKASGKTSATTASGQPRRAQNGHDPPQNRLNGSSNWLHVGSDAVFILLSLHGCLGSFLLVRKITARFRSRSSLLPTTHEVRNGGLGIRDRGFWRAKAE